MSKTVVIYRSKQGSTEQYAIWLGQELSCDVVNIADAKIKNIIEYDTIILGGGVYMGAIRGLGFIRNNYSKLANKKVILFAVGASPGGETYVKELCKSNLKDNISKLQLFYCRGNMDIDRLGFLQKMMMKMIASSMTKKGVENLNDSERSMLESINKTKDNLDKAYISPIVDMAR